MNENEKDDYYEEMQDENRVIEFRDDEPAESVEDDISDGSRQQVYEDYLQLKSYEEALTSKAENLSEKYDKVYRIAENKGDSVVWKKVTPSEYGAVKITPRKKFRIADPSDMRISIPEAMRANTEFYNYLVEYQDEIDRVEISFDVADDVLYDAVEMSPDEELPNPKPEVEPESVQGVEQNVQNKSANRKKSSAAQKVIKFLSSASAQLPQADGKSRASTKQNTIASSGFGTSFYSGTSSGNMFSTNWGTAYNLGGTRGKSAARSKKNSVGHQSYPRMNFSGFIPASNSSKMSNNFPTANFSGFLPASSKTKEMNSLPIMNFSGFIPETVSGKRSGKKNKKSQQSGLSFTNFKF